MKSCSTGRSSRRPWLVSSCNSALTSQLSATFMPLREIADTGEHATGKELLHWALLTGEDKDLVTLRYMPLQ